MGFIDIEGLAGLLRKKGGTFGLLSQQASPVAERLAREFMGSGFKCLFSAEHGYFGLAGAGEKTSSLVHPAWGIPVHSLYGATRKPTAEMLEGLERIVVDLQDIGVRCYTYLATLKNVLEAAAPAGIEVVVLDRPVPFAGEAEGPMLEKGLESFVAPVNVHMRHGMTPGECARWIVREEGLDVKLEIVELKNWKGMERRPWANFMPPSPAIRSWDAAAIYPVTVFTEAFPSVDCDRAGSYAFRVFGVEGLDARAICGDLSSGALECGFSLRPFRYVPQGKDKQLDGVLISLSEDDAAPYRPCSMGALILEWLYGHHTSTLDEGARWEWLAKLYGTEKLGDAIKGGTVRALAKAW